MTRPLNLKSDLIPLASAKELKRTTHPSLYLEVLLFFHKWFTLYWFCSTFILYIEKLRLFFYTTEACTWEMSMIILIPIIDFIRLKLASRGNKTERWNILLWSTILSIPLLIGHFFFLRLQFYVLRYDFYLNVFALTFVVLEMTISISTMLDFYQHSPWSLLSLP